MNPRVLIVTPVFTHPPTQGNAARILAFGRQLKRHGVGVDVLHYMLDGGTSETADAMRAEWAHVEQLAGRPHRRMSFPFCWGLDDWCPDELVDSVARMARSVSYDAVIVNYVWMTRCFEGLPSGPLRILDTHDLFGDRHVLSRSYGLDPNWYFTTRDEEDRGFDRADIIIAIQDVEEKAIAARARARVTTVGHPLAPAFLKFADSSVKVATFGYLGSGNPWNQKALLDFDAAVVRSGGLDWAIGGTICQSGVKLESVRFMFGVVERPEHMYRHIECCLNPMESGTGLKIKTIEAMAYGRPLIGTRVAFEGLDTRHAFHRLDDAESMVAAAAEYAASDRVRSELLEASRALYFGYMDSVRRQYADLAGMIKSGR